VRNETSKSVTIKVQNGQDFTVSPL